MADRPSITVAIPTFNGARHLADALRGILAQQGVEFQLVISDDRSEDETLSVVAAVAGDRARVAINSERLGLAGNWNRCLALAQTPLVTIFHQDDVMRPTHLATHVAAFESAEQPGLVVSATDLIDATGKLLEQSGVERGGLAPVDRSFPPGTLLPELAVGNPLRCSAVSLRRVLIARIGEFNASYQYSLDWEFWIRASRATTVAWRARPTVAVRWHSASETHRFKTATADLDEQVHLLDTLYSDEAARWPDRQRLRRAADQRLARAFLNRAYDLLRGGDPCQARACLRRAVTLSPRIVAAAVFDPRLLLQMAALTVAPQVAGKLFRKPCVRS